MILRLSTNAGDILDDAVSLPRGMAIKVLDVDGERLPGADGTAQDFVLVNGPVFQAPTADKFLGNLKLLAKTTDHAEGAKVALSAVLRGFNKALTAVGIESPKVQSLGGAPQTEPLGETFFSTVPFRYGDYIAKFSVRPVAPEQTALTGKEIATDGDYDAIRHRVQDEAGRVRHGVGILRAAGARSAKSSRSRTRRSSGRRRTRRSSGSAIIHAAAQDSWAPDAVDEVEDHLRFSVWTGLAAHQPLGNINRARKSTYDNSAGFRERFNGCPIHEPGGAGVPA